MVHKRKQSRLKYWLKAVPNAYGFGHDYFLMMSDGKKTKSFMLGQDAKVFSRMLGIDMRDAVDMYSKKAKSKDFDKVSKYIATDIVKASVGRNNMNWESPVTQKELKGLFEAQAWELSVQ